MLTRNSSWNQEWIADKKYTWNQEWIADNTQNFTIKTEQMYRESPLKQGEDRKQMIYLSLLNLIFFLEGAIVNKKFLLESGMNRW